MKRIFAACLLCCMFVVAGCKAEVTDAEMPKWHVLTSLPLFMGEGDVNDVINGDSGQSLLITKLSEKRQIAPLDTLGGDQLKQVRYLLAVQPARLPPAELVALNEWVRAGGRAVILADPDMAWPLRYLPGDPRMPPRSTMLDPLFAHWGVTLDGTRAAPAQVSVRIGSKDAVLVNPGRWRAQAGNCEVSDQQLLATCTLGKGRVILLSDADVADPRLWDESQHSNLRVIEQLLERIDTQGG